MTIPEGCRHSGLREIDMLRDSSPMVVVCWFFLAAAAWSAEPAIIGHWPLRGDAREQSGAALATTSRGVDFETAGPGGTLQTAARLNGRDSFIDVSDAQPLRLGTGEFS